MHNHIYFVTGVELTRPHVVDIPFHIIWETTIVPPQTLKTDIWVFQLHLLYRVMSPDCHEKVLILHHFPSCSLPLSWKLESLMSRTWEVLTFCANWFHVKDNGHISDNGAFNQSQNQHRHEAWKWHHVISLSQPLKKDTDVVLPLYAAVKREDANISGQRGSYLERNYWFTRL